MESLWIEYQGKRIFYIDLANFMNDDAGFEARLKDLVARGQDMYSQPPHTVLCLVDLRGTKMTPRVQKLLSTVINDTNKYIRKTAVIGMTGFRGVFLDFFGRLANSDTQGFDDPEDGKKWLVR